MNDEARMERLERRQNALESAVVRVEAQVQAAGRVVVAQTEQLDKLVATVKGLADVCQAQAAQIELLRLKTEAMRGHIRALATIETVEDMWKGDE